MPDAIAVRSAELNARCRRVRPGMTLAEVHEALGGQEFKAEQRQGTWVRFWRFRVLDAARPSDAEEIYEAEFPDDRLSVGWILPHG
jgi:ribose 1,5-bisphosphokinase PhnN